MNPAQIQAATGSGVFFYAWNANGHCSTDTSINPTGKCPELWTDIIKNINAQIPASADRAKIKFIYLDSVSLNLPAPPISKTIFTVGGCDDGASTDIVFCTRSAGLTYSSPQAESGYTAVSELNNILNPVSGSSAYDIIPTISDSGSLETLNANQLKSVAYSLACIANPKSTTTPSGIPGGPNSCTDVLTGASLKPQNLTLPTSSGLGFDIEPDLSNAQNTGDNKATASDFYTALQSFMNQMITENKSPSELIMVSRGPTGLNEKQGGISFGSVINTLNQTPSSVTFIFSPQIYDLCDGMGTWACPITPPLLNPLNADPTTDDYAHDLLFQPVPSYPIGAGLDWATFSDSQNEGTLYFSKLGSMSYQFFNELNNHTIPTSTSYPSVPVQLMISGGGSSQLWSHVNVYNADFSDSNPTSDPYLTNVLPYPLCTAANISAQNNSGTPAGAYCLNPEATTSSANLNFQPFMIYENKKACQAENPDGSLSQTIPNCVNYPNPYSETIASYASTLFASLQNVLSSSSSANLSSVFSGVTLYPFTPYGFWDATCTKKSSICQGYFPEMPDGLMNGEKPQISFWDAYLNQFSNQWIASSTGTIPTQTSTPAPRLFITLPNKYYTLNPGSGNNLGTATVLFNTATYPNGQIPSISSYRANLIDAIGQIIATGTSLTSGSIMINNAPGGNYKLEVQALDQNGSVLASTEAAAEGAGLPPVLQIALSQVALSGTPTSSSYTLSWTLSCSSNATLLSGFLAVSQLYATGSSAPLTRLTQWIANPVCNKTYQSTFSLSAGTLPSTATQASLVLQQAGTFQNITTTTYVPITIPSS